MSYRYVVLGAGAQGVAAAYDLACFGQASRIVLVDADGAKAHQGALRVNSLVGKDVVVPKCADVGDRETLKSVLSGADALVSAISYKLNELITDVAIEVGAHMVDLGGNTKVVTSQHLRDPHAKASGVSIVPDCGMGPGFNLSLAHSALSAMAQPTHISIYCGGLPQKPEGELRYALCFAMDGLVNEYSGRADVLEGGRTQKKQCLGYVEVLDVPSLGSLEASFTSGGLSTAPWTYKSAFPTLQNLRYKTLRYPGHWELLRKFRKEGRLREELEARLGTTIRDFPDIGLIIVYGYGRDKSGSHVNVTRVVVDRYDPKTGFTAMQRLTGFHAAIVAQLAVSGRIPRGVIPVELVDGDLIIAEMAKRGIITNDFE